MFNYILYKIGEFLALHLPLKAAYAVAVKFSDLRYLFAYQDRKQVTQNLKAIFPEKSEQEISKIRLQVFRNFAKYLLDFFRFPAIDMQYIQKNVTIENLHYLDESLKKGKGIIVLAAHMGNWELGGAVMGMLGYRFWVVAFVHQHKKTNEFFNSRRRSKGVKVIPLGRAVRTCLELLKNNEVVALVGDRDFSERGVVLDFFGKPMIFPEGPAALALKTQAIILPTVMLRNPDDSFTLKFDPPVEVNYSLNSPEPLKLDKKAIEEIILRYKLIFESYIRKYPEQWFMFRRFWVS